MPDIRRTGAATVLGVFHQFGSEASALVKREYHVDFPLVDDVNGRAAEAFGIRRSASELAQDGREFEEEPLLLREGEPWIRPMQARFIIGADGKVAWSEILFDYGERSSALGLLPILERLR
jgi:hypothetical protein